MIRLTVLAQEMIASKGMSSWRSRVWKMESDHVQAIEQILTKAFGFDQRLRIFIGAAMTRTSS